MLKREMVGQFVAFGIIGTAGFLLDVATFNYLSFTVLSAHVVAGGPLWAKAASTSVAVVTNWLGNRFVTFRSNRRSDVLREGVEFALVSVAGGVIAIVCLGVSHYGLGFTSRLADNIAGNLIGLALGSAFRFTVYQKWVYSELRGVRRR
jgi:putative flippase GtrA